MVPGDSVKGRLRPLWNLYPGGRDALAKAVGTTGPSLSSLNSGKRGLGEKLGPRLIAELTSKGIDASPLVAPKTAATIGDGTLSLWLKFLPFILDAPETPDFRLLVQQGADELEASGLASLRVAAALRERLARVDRG